MRLLPVLTLALALPLNALAGTCAVKIHETETGVRIEPGTTTEQPLRVGRWFTRILADQAKADDGSWTWSLRLERRQSEGWELLLEPTFRSGPGLDVVYETNSRLGPVYIRCKD